MAVLALLAITLRAAEQASTKGPGRILPTKYVLTLDNGLALRVPNKMFSIFFNFSSSSSDIVFFCLSIKKRKEHYIVVFGCMNIFQKICSKKGM